MRRLIEAKDTILAAILLVFALFLMAERTDGGLNNLRTVSLSFISLVEQPLSNLRIYRNALETNRYLQRQNVLLQDELNRLRSAESEIRSLRSLLGLREDSSSELIPAQVTGHHLTGLNNFLTLDAGAAQGIQDGMPVVSSNGLVGTVILTGSDVAQVMPYASTLFRVSARVEGSRAYGIARWSQQEQNLIYLDHIPKTIVIPLGETVVTSGMGNRYPAGITIGEVIGTEPEPGKDTQRVYVQSLTELRTLTELFVIPFLPDPETEWLQERQEAMN